ncbi:hypothetical protein D3C80_781790 [compost metagenome]
MKYGIRVTYEDGSVEYAYAAKGGRISATDDITDTALFAQEDSAIKALKQARKEGYETKNNCSLDVVGIEYTVVKVTEVARPPKKAGFVITGEKPNYWKKIEQVWFSGTKKAGGYINWSDALESATVLPSEEDCRAKIEEARQEWLEAIEDKKKSLTKGYPYHHSWNAAVEKKRWEDALVAEIADKEAKTVWFDELRIEST